MLPKDAKPLRRWQPYQFGNAPRTIPGLCSDGTANLDFSVVKNNRVADGVNLQLRFEWFNFTNRPRFDLPNTTIGTPGVGIGFHPVAVSVGALTEHFLAHHWDAQDMADEMDHLLRAGKPAEIAVDDDTVEAVVYKSEQIAEKPGEVFRRTYSTQAEDIIGPENHQVGAGQAAHRG